MFEKLTRLSDMNQMENFLTYGKWDLSDADVERLKKDEEMKQRVRILKQINIQMGVLEEMEHWFWSIQFRGQI